MFWMTADWQSIKYTFFVTTINVLLSSCGSGDFTINVIYIVYPDNSKTDKHSWQCHIFSTYESYIDCQSFSQMSSTKMSLRLMNFIFIIFGGFVSNSLWRCGPLTSNTFGWFIHSVELWVHSYSSGYIHWAKIWY